MSQKHSQTSRTQSPQEDEEPRVASEDSSITLVEQTTSEWDRASRRLDNDSVGTTPSTDDDVHQTRAKQAQPQIPIMLVAAELPPIMKDAQVGAESHRNTRAGSIGLNLRSTSSDQYDQDEPLTTKVVKVYKKRHRKVNSAPYDSDDSFEGKLINADEDHPLATSPNLTETDNPRSDTTDTLMGTDVSSDDFSSSGSLLLYNSGITDPNYSQHNGQPGFKLASGMAFIYMAIPPDGGYGWVVLCLSFLAQLIVDGIVFSVGILLPHISAEFNVSSAQVVLVGSLQIGCYFMGGAFSSALINSYGFRPVALLGVGVSAMSILVASFSPNLLTLIISYSIIGGPGLSMIWVSSQLIIGYYFERYRPIASGFSCSGAGAGIFIFSITNSLLVVRIGWRNTIRVQVALLLLLCFVALAYLEVAPSPVGVLHHDHLTTSSSNEYYGNFYVHNFLGDDVSSKKSHAVLETYKPPKKQGRVRRWASRCSPCFGKPSRKGDQRHHQPDEDHNYIVRADPIQREDLFYTGPADYTEPHNLEQVDGKELELVGSQAHIQRAAYALHNIHDYDTTDDSTYLSGSDKSNVHDRRTSQRPQVYRRKKPQKHKNSWLGTKVKKAMNRLFDVHLLKSFEFRVLLVSAFLYPMGFNIPFVYSKARTTIPLQYAQWISPAIGATSFIVRILCGFVAYKLRYWTSYICGGGMMLGGIMVFISAFYGNDLVWFQFVYGLLYGVAPAVYATLRALIYVRYLGLSKLTNAFGITALAMGLGVFMGTTLGGILLDNTGGYTAPFAFAGLCITISGLLKLILPVWVRHRRIER